MAEETTLDELLINEVGKQIENLKKLTPGTEQHEKAVKDISLLYKLHNEGYDLANKYDDIQNRKAIDEKRTELEKEKLEFEKEKYNLEKAKLEFEKEQAKKKEAREKEVLKLETVKFEFEKSQAAKEESKEKKIKFIDLGIFAIEQTTKMVTLFVPLIWYRRMFMAGLEFETNGSVSSKFFGNYLNKLKPNRVD